MLLAYEYVLTVNAAQPNTVRLPMLDLLAAQPGEPLFSFFQDTVSKLMDGQSDPFTAGPIQDESVATLGHTARRVTRLLNEFHARPEDDGTPTYGALQNSKVEACLEAEPKFASTLAQIATRETVGCRVFVTDSGNPFAIQKSDGESSAMALTEIRASVIGHDGKSRGYSMEPGDIFDLSLNGIRHKKPQYGIVSTHSMDAIAAIRPIRLSDLGGPIAERRKHSYANLSEGAIALSKTVKATDLQGYVQGAIAKREKLGEKVWSHV
ncbi:MAG TPA: hypothetical protein VLH38_00180 [Patescibacteria group bacterium]|nr:hypothetical protein [Patescibacteria group bacterium]